MTGILRLQEINTLCNSRPLMPGIRRSRIRQAESSRDLEQRNSSAEAKTVTSNPIEMKSLFRALRMDASSSTIEIKADPFINCIPFGDAAARAGVFYKRIHVLGKLSFGSAR